jgi:hypothetical protein
MTKYEKKIKEMLGYYEIVTDGNRDEKMTKAQRKKFLDNLNTNYDRYVMEDIVSKVKDKFKDMKDEEGLEESDESFFDSLGDESDEFPKGNLPKENNASNKDFMDMNPDIEMFISWLYNLLYSADHRLTVNRSPDGMITNIRMEKLKKKGGKKK